MRQNLMQKMRAGEELFPGIVGYDDTVIPQIENAILSGQDIVLLGERGQAKTRIARSLVNLLDAETPVIAGCEINDNPFHPICRACRDRVAEEGDETPIHWIARDVRYGEKLATPDQLTVRLLDILSVCRFAHAENLVIVFRVHAILPPHQ